MEELRKYRLVQIGSGRNKFNIGDIVRTKSYSAYSDYMKVPIGSIGTITKIRSRYVGSPHEHYQYKVTFNGIPDGDDLTNMFEENNLEKIYNGQKLNVGDYVMRTGGKIDGIESNEKIGVVGIVKKIEETNQLISNPYSFGKEIQRNVCVQYPDSKILLCVPEIDLVKVTDTQYPYMNPLVSVPNIYGNPILTTTTSESLDNMIRQIVKTQDDDDSDDEYDIGDTVKIKKDTLKCSTKDKILEGKVKHICKIGEKKMYCVKVKSLSDTALICVPEENII
jgi:hypothetical protein